jgi:hypothetical protein
MLLRTTFNNISVVSFIGGGNRRKPDMLYPYLLTLPLCAGVSHVRALSPAWTGSPDFEGPSRQLSKSSARKKNQVQ